MTESIHELIFLSYANPDSERVLPYFEYLEGRGFKPWMDRKSLRAGQNWDWEIRRALDKAAFILVFVSNNSIDRRGYAQREIRIALDKAEERLIGDIYIIPILLDEGVAIPVQFKGLHCVKAWEGNSYSAIEDAINHQLRDAGIESLAAQEKAKLSWRRVKHKESWDGCPGYETEVEFLEFSSSRFQQVADITNFIRGQLLTTVMDQRSVILTQITDFFSFGQNRGFRTNWLDARCSEPIVRGRVISIPYTVNWYGAGAAHPNMHFRTFSFFLDPVIFISSLKQIFADRDAALSVIQTAIREQLLTATPEGKMSLDKDWVEGGTQDWGDFHSFVFKESEVEFLFPPYQIASYAAGSKQAKVGYERLAGLMQNHYADALGIGHLRRRCNSSG